MGNIYFDNAATTPMNPEVAELMYKTMLEDFGNPSSTHSHGRKTKSLVENSRKTIADGLNCSIGEVYFTSCGTESNNTILKCVVRDLGVTRVITSKIEHPCILNSVKTIKRTNDIDLVLLTPDECGRITAEMLEVELQKSDAPTLVSLMHANNEIGTINNLAELGAVCKKYKAYFHSDTIQTLTHVPIDLNNIDIDFISGSAHKFRGPKGVGFFYMNSDAIFQPYLDGGGQERTMRSGTENIYGILGLAKAFEMGIHNFEERYQKIEHLRNYLKQELIKHIPDVGFNGCQENYLNTILSVRFPEHEKNEMLQMYLDIKGISVSGGSACSSGTTLPSHVLSGINMVDNSKTIRVSFNHDNTTEEIDRLISTLKEIYQLN